MAPAFCFTLMIGLFLWSQGVRAGDPWSSQHALPSLARPAIPPRPGPTLRVDIIDKAGSLFCGGSPPSPADLWAAEIFDAQLEGRQLLVVGSAAPEDLLAKAKQRAWALAQGGAFNGYAFGVCASGKTAWALAVPSSEALSAETRTGRVMLPQAALEAQCVSWSIDFAGHARGMPRILPPPGGGELDVSRLPRGMFSVTCQPKGPQDQGPVLWFLKPVLGGPDLFPPEREGLREGLPDRALALWVNRVRAREGLKPLEWSPDLSHFADLLATDGSLKHNRAEQASVTQKLKGSPLTAVGEDRVRARDSEGMAWLLWNSPRHRGLLLRSDASAIGIGLQTLETELLAVLLTGRKVVQRSMQGPLQRPRPGPP